MSIEDRLTTWLRDERGIDAYRRLAQQGPQRIIVSKFEEGFFATLQARLRQLPELFDTAAVRAGYDATAAADPTLTRVAAWHAASLALLDRLGAERGLDSAQRAEVAAGIDSVAAVLDTVLWSGPLAAAEYAPLPGERAAYHDALTQLQPERDLFTRHYGSFEGTPVVNYCPAAAYARKLLAQAWEVCTGTEAPG